MWVWVRGVLGEGEGEGRGRGGGDGGWYGERGILCVVQSREIREVNK